MDAWLQLMQEEIITGSFRGETDNSVYIWMRRFETEAEREQQYKAVYESDRWKNELTDRVGELINRETRHVQRIVPTKLSILK